MFNGLKVVKVMVDDQKHEARRFGHGMISRIDLRRPLSYNRRRTRQARIRHADANRLPIMRTGIAGHLESLPIVRHPP